jgi:hypothetical protein
MVERLQTNLSGDLQTSPEPPHSSGPRWVFPCGSSRERPASSCCRTGPSFVYSRHAPQNSDVRWEGRRPWPEQSVAEELPTSMRIGAQTSRCFKAIPARISCATWEMMPFSGMYLLDGCFDYLFSKLLLPFFSATIRKYACSLEDQRVPVCVPTIAKLQQQRTRE